MPTLAASSSTRGATGGRLGQRQKSDEAKKYRNRKSDEEEDYEDCGAAARGDENTFDDYDDCKDIVDELKKSSSHNDDFKLKPNTGANRAQRPLGANNTDAKLTLSSPLKRGSTRNEGSSVEESPKKRIKMPVFATPTSQAASDSSSAPDYADAKAKSNLAVSNFRNRFSPRKQRSSSMCEEPAKKSFASTPKSERKPQSRLKQVVDAAAMERNLSNSWADIIEELEEQTKELNDFMDKVAAKYKLEKEVLMKNLECDTETLRKRQKRINFGKVTDEYKRYITALPRKDRKPYHPRTPNKFRKCSRRKFDGLIKKWRKLLHVWDENPDALIDYKNSMETNEDYNDDTEDFGCTSNITASNFSYIVDDYDIIDEDYKNIDEAAAGSK